MAAHAGDAVDVAGVALQESNEKITDSAQLKYGSDGSLHDYPTEEDLVTLHRVAGKIPLKAFTIAFIELCERFSYYGTVVLCKSLFPF